MLEDRNFAERLARAVDDDITGAQAETTLVRVVKFLRDLVAVFEGDGALLFRRAGVDVAGVAFLDAVALVAVAPRRMGTATNAVTRSCGVRAKKRSVSSKSGWWNFAEFRRVKPAAIVPSVRAKCRARARARCSASG